jgi:2-(1,2-epoxy-1,2-dihydrophenyl)acetyl-CoA isomerase
VSTDISLTDAGGVFIVEGHRPPSNFFDHSFLAGLADACEEAQASPRCHAVLLCTEGRNFCAGADFSSTEMSTDRNAMATRIYEEGLRLFELDVPVVAAVQGRAVGGGLGLACAADFRVASEASTFHANFGQLGFHHGFALTVTLPLIVGEQAAGDLLLTSRRVDGGEAHRLGLVDRLAEPGAERETAATLASEIATCGRDALRAMKRTLRAELRTRVRGALAHELQEQQVLWATPDCQQRMAAAANRVRTR